MYILSLFHHPLAVVSWKDLPFWRFCFWTKISFWHSSFLKTSWRSLVVSHWTSFWFISLILINDLEIFSLSFRIKILQLLLVLLYKFLINIFTQLTTFTHLWDMNIFDNLISYLLKIYLQIHFKDNVSTLTKHRVNKLFEHQARFSRVQ